MQPRYEISRGDSVTGITELTDALAGKVPKRHMRRMGQKAHGIDGGFESQKALEETYSERERRVLRLWLRLVRTSRRIEADVGAQMYKTFGVRFVRFDVLSQLYRAPDYSLSIGDLGASLLAPSGNISSLLDRMEADGLVKRIADPYDRRRYIIRLTQKGIDTFAEMAKANAHWVAGAFSAIDDETLDRLHDELASIAES